MGGEFEPAGRQGTRSPSPCSGAHSGTGATAHPVGRYGRRCRSGLQPLEARKVAINMLFQRRVCLNNDFVPVTGDVCHIPAVYCGDVTKRLEKGTFMSKWILKIPVFLTSSGECPYPQARTRIMRGETWGGARGAMFDGEVPRACVRD